MARNVTEKLESKKQSTLRRKSASKVVKETGSKRTVERVTGRFVVAPNPDGWVVKRVGSKRQRLFQTQADAIAAATKTARNAHSDLVIQRKDGTIKEWLSTSAADLALLKFWKSTHEANSRAKKR
jgi:hypothetical protein